MRFIFAVFCLISTFSAAQVREDFGDGDFSQSPAWLGDLGQYKVNNSKQLQLNSAGTDTSVLYTGATLYTNTEWQIWLKMAFSPSDNNYLRVYLVADQPPKLPLKGYYLRLGENGSFDSVDLWKQEGAMETKIIDGKAGRCAASSNTFRIKVIRDSLAMWTLYSDSTGGEDFTLEGQVLDSAFNAGNYMGVFSKYTSSNATDFYYDDIYMGRPGQFHLPPPVYDISEGVSLLPGIFSPDNDGYQDQLSIAYLFGSPGFVANVIIYDSYGREVRKLVKNEYLGASGAFAWDGLREDQARAEIGIYIVFFEVFNEAGEVRKFKKACVLAKKF